MAKKNKRAVKKNERPSKVVRTETVSTRTTFGSLGAVLGYAAGLGQIAAAYGDGGVRDVTYADALRAAHRVGGMFTIGSSGSCVELTNFDSFKNTPPKWSFRIADYMEQHRFPGKIGSIFYDRASDLTPTHVMPIYKTAAQCNAVDRG